jgi:hypothetical protein
MYLPFLAALRQLGNDLAAVLTPATIRAACRAVGHTRRERQLDPVTTVHLFVLRKRPVKHVSAFGAAGDGSGNRRGVLTRPAVGNRPAKCSLAELRSHSLGGCSSHAVGRSGAGLASGT